MYNRPKDYSLDCGPLLATIQRKGLSAIMKGVIARIYRKDFFLPQPLMPIVMQTNAMKKEKLDMQEEQGLLHYGLMAPFLPYHWQNVLPLYLKFEYVAAILPYGKILKRNIGNWSKDQI